MGGARLLTVDEVAGIVRKTRRTIESWAADKKSDFPAPVNVGSNSVLFPLGSLIAWARTKNEALAAEFEKLADSAPPRKSPERIEAQVARKLTGLLGEKVHASEVVLGTTRPMRASELAAARALALDKFRDSPFVDLDFDQAMLVACHLFPSMREFFATNPRNGHSLPRNADDAYRLAQAALLHGSDEDE